MSQFSVYFTFIYLHTNYFAINKSSKFRFTEEWKTLMLKNYDWFLSNENYVSDESKRLKSNKTKSDCFENESFKMLVVD